MRLKAQSNGHFELNEISKVKKIRLIREWSRAMEHIKHGSLLMNISQPVQRYGSSLFLFNWTLVCADATWSIKLKVQCLSGWHSESTADAIISSFLLTIIPYVKKWLECEELITLSIKSLIFSFSMSLKREPLRHWVTLKRQNFCIIVDFLFIVESSALLFIFVKISWPVFNAFFKLPSIIRLAFRHFEYI